MNERIRELVMNNLKHRMTKDQVVEILRRENIPINMYNEFILERLSRSWEPQDCRSKTLSVVDLLDREYLRDVLSTRRMAGERCRDKRTLFEDRRISARYYNSTRHLSCRMMDRLMNTDEILEKFKICAVELGLSGNISRKCAEYLNRGLELYVKDLVGTIDGEITIPRLKRSLKTHLRLFNGLDIL